MTDRPILYSKPMVRALLDDRKSQTRRILTKARTFATPDARPFTLRGADLARALQNAADFRSLGEDCWTWTADAFEYQAPALRTHWNAHLGYAVGDRLWVREAWWHPEPYSYGTTSGGCEITSPRMVSRAAPTHFAADGDPPNCANRHYGRDGLRPGSGAFAAPDPWAVWTKRPSIHMPRWVSRLTQIVTEVRVKRLQDISEADAIAEGVDVFVETIDRIPWGNIGSEDRAALVRATYGSHRRAYEHLWEIINGPDSWAENPFVVATSFDVHHLNIDAMPQAAIAA